MRKTSNLSNLSFCKNYGSLAVVGGNPSVVKVAADGNRQRLTLIQGKLVAKKPKPAKASQTVNPGGKGSPSPPSLSSSSRFSSVLKLLSWANGNDGAITFLAAVISVSFFFGSWYMKSGLREELKGYVDDSLKEALNPLREDIRKMGNAVEKLRAEVENVKGKLNIPFGIVYKSEASALGLKDPQVVPIQLSKLSAAASPDIQLTDTLNDGSTYHLEFKVETVTQDSITFLVNGVIRGQPIIDARFVRPRQVGIPIELDRVISLPGMPKILFTILDFPTKDTAVVAVGERSNP